MDPDAPRRPSSSAAAQRSLTRVQRWVMSTLAVTTILHLAVGLIIAAAVVDDDRMDARVGLLIIAGCFGVLSVVAALAIHQKPLLSPWLLLGVVPAVVGIAFVF